MTFLRQGHDTAMLAFILSSFNPSSLLTALSYNNTMMQLFCAKLFYHFIPTRITASRERGYVHLRLILPLPLGVFTYTLAWLPPIACLSYHLPPNMARSTTLFQYAHDWRRLVRLMDGGLRHCGKREAARQQLSASWDGCSSPHFIRFTSTHNHKQITCAC